MNALKHGLDAQTLILPGEDEAAYRSRLDAWRADLKPRDATEEALVAEAVRLSWLLDRADRADADARLAAAEVPPADDEEAAEAERIGERLIAGPPVVSPPPAADAEEAASRQFRAVLHPDDPAHPARLLRQLEATAAGCRWLIGRWLDLDGDLQDDDGTGWAPDRRRMAVRLLGKEPIEALDDPEVRRIYLCSFLLGGRDPQVFTDQADEMTKAAFRLFLQRLKARAAARAVPAGRASALEDLRGVVAGVLGRLEEQAAMHAARAERQAALAPVLLAIDTSPAGERLHRLQRRILASLLRTVDLLRKVQRRPEPSPRVDACAGDPRPCEKIRNEPNAPGRPARPAAPIATTSDASPEFPIDCAKTRNEPNAPTGSVSAVAGRGPGPAGCTHPMMAIGIDPGSAAKYALIPGATPEVSTHCDPFRNEPLPAGPALSPNHGRTQTVRLTRRAGRPRGIGRGEVQRCRGSSSSLSRASCPRRTYSGPARRPRPSIRRSVVSLSVVATVAAPAHFRAHPST